MLFCNTTCDSHDEDNDAYAPARGAHDVDERFKAGLELKDEQRSVSSTRSERISGTAGPREILDEELGTRLSGIVSPALEILEWAIPGHPGRACGSSRACEIM